MKSLQHRRVLKTCKKVLLPIVLLVVLLSHSAIHKQWINTFKKGHDVQYQGGLIDDVRFIKCYRWYSHCDTIYDKQHSNGPLIQWKRVHKKMRDSNLYAINSGMLYSTYLYVHSAKKTTFGTTRAITDLAIAREKTVVPLHVLKDVNLQIRSSDNSVFHNHEYPQEFSWSIFGKGSPTLSVDDEDWEYKSDGIWCKYSLIQEGSDDTALTNLQIYLGDDFIESRPMWKEAIHGKSRGRLAALSITSERFNKNELVDNVHIANTLSLKSQGFKILQLSDLHYSSGMGVCNEPPCLADFQTRNFISTVIDREKPDLVVITGDILDGVNTLDYETALLKAVQPMVSSRTPYAIAFGLQDFSTQATKRDILEFIGSLPFCMNSVNNDSNVINLDKHSFYTTNIALPIHKGEEISGMVYVLDSTDVESQDSFLRNAHASALLSKHTKPMYSFAFQHLPTIEYRPTGLFAIIGSYNEKKQLSDVIPRTKLRDTLGELKVQVLSCGYEHGNDCCLHSTGPEYTGELWLCYGGVSGLSGYQIEGMSPNIRLFGIDDEKGEITSWKRSLANPEEVYDYQYIYKP